MNPKEKTAQEELIKIIFGRWAKFCTDTSIVEDRWVACDQFARIAFPNGVKADVHWVQDMGKFGWASVEVSGVENNYMTIPIPGSAGLEMTTDGVPIGPGEIEVYDVSSLQRYLGQLCHIDTSEMPEYDGEA